MAEARFTTPIETVLAYHEHSKHRLDGYAPGPETLDWSAQPSPFREFAGAPRIALPLTAHWPTAAFSDLHVPAKLPPQALQRDKVASLLELSFALSAWKSYGPDLWSLRCNPSSGNLHPTEAWLVCRNIPGLEDGVYHYLSRDHALELRCQLAPATTNAPELWLGLSSVMWREAWKYGLRAFRYCQLDTGHALGALRYAAAALGWQARLEPACDTAALDALLGLDREIDYAGVEREEAECLVRIDTEIPALIPGAPPAALPQAVDPWFGKPSLLDPHPMYHWPQIEAVAAASRALPLDCDVDTPTAAPLSTASANTAIAADRLIRQRRSAQRFDASHSQDSGSFWAMLDALMPRQGAPWDVWPWSPRLHLLLFVNRVTDVLPGLYILPRSPSGEQLLRTRLHPHFEWRTPTGCPEALPLYLLAQDNLCQSARRISCHQAIASDGCFSLAMLAEFEQPLQDAPWRYRHLFQEAGLIGQALYLQAEAAGLRGTGIGCFFDDACHELAGIRDHQLQSLYHFTVGAPLTDARILSLPPYS